MAMHPRIQRIICLTETLLCFAGVALLLTPNIHSQIPPFEWVRDAGGPDYDQGLGVACDNATNIYVTGNFRGSGVFGGTLLTNSYNGSPLDGMFIAKYDSSGSVLWAKGIKNNNVSYGFAVAVDSNGNSFVTGQFLGTATFGSTNITSIADIDVFLAKYTSAGNVAWVRQGRGTSYEGGRSVTLDANGNVHCVGIFGSVITFGSTSVTNTNGQALFHLKYDNSGNLLWLRVAASPLLNDGRFRVVSDSAGNSYVAGSVNYQNGVANLNGVTVTNSNVYSSAFLTKADPSGNPTWVKVSSGDTAYGSGVGIRGDTDIYLGGTMGQTLTLGTNTIVATGRGGHSFIAHCDASGNFSWARVAGSGSIEGFAVDPLGNTYIAGDFTGTNKLDSTNLISSGDYDFFVAQFDSSGTFAWAKKAGGASGDYARSLALDPARNVYVTGIFSGNANFETTNVTTRGVDDIYLVKIPGSPQLEPVITTQPQHQTVTAGTTARFTVGVYGTLPFHYQWRFNGSNIIGATQPVLAIGNAQSGDQGNYAVLVTNAYGAITSSVVTLAVDYAIAVNPAGGGTVTLIPNLTNYSAGTMVTVVGTPASGWSFLGWLGDLGDANPTNTLLMTRNFCMRPIFGTSIATAVSGNGMISVAPPVPFFPYNSSVRLSATPQSGSYFAGWATDASGTNNPLTLVLTNSGLNIAALFAPLSGGQFALAVQVAGMGRVTPYPSRYGSGQIASLTAIAEPGQTFLGWSGDASGSQTNLNLVMNQNRIVTANFTSRPRWFVDPCSGGFRDDGYQLTLLGESGARYDIGVSTNLPSWSPLLLLTNSFGTSQFLDSSSTNVPMRFYRATIVP